MADIELVIKIPEGLKKDFELEQWTALSCMEMKDALMNGTPLPKGHGDLINRKDVHKAIDEWINADEYAYSYATRYLRRRIDNAPTIIEADKESE